VELEVITPTTYISAVMQFTMERRGLYVNTEYLGATSHAAGARAMLHFNLQLSELLTDFYDTLKSVSSGYASLNYLFLDFREVDLAKVAFFVAYEKKEALTMLVPRQFAEARARRVLEILQKEIPPQQFEVRLQAAIGGTIIASERIRPLRKDVTAKLYGGDVTRKRKLLEKQKKGKKRLAAGSTVEIPHKAYLAVLKR
ncbi:MAG TPA: elongation factor 4, partial [Gammaproteobacteria bacterium]|nr:elongation factor 4 [Gammaproteobacteria bacterium]